MESIKPTVCTLTTANGDEWMRVDALTQGLAAKDFSVPYAVEFYAVIHYTNGSEQTRMASSIPFTRTAKQVAIAALADTAAGYSDEALNILDFVASYT